VRFVHSTFDNGILLFSDFIKGKSHFICHIVPFALIVFYYDSDVYLQLLDVLFIATVVSNFKIAQKA
jgi:hypothetical protein